MHVGVEAPRLLATNSSVTTTTASTLYVKGPPVASTNQTITHAYSLLVDSGDVRIDEDLIVGGNIDLEGDIDVNGTLETDALTIGGAAVLAQATASAVGAVELATTAEADTGTDTARAITAAGLKSHVDTRYSYSYITLSASAKPTKDGSDNPEWMVPNINKGIYEEDWNKDTGITSTTVGATAYALGRYTAVNSFIIPHAGILVGFRAIGRNGTADRTFKAGLFHADNGFGGAGADGSDRFPARLVGRDAALRDRSGPPHHDAGRQCWYSYQPAAGVAGLIAGPKLTPTRSCRAACSYSRRRRG